MRYFLNILSALLFACTTVTANTDQLFKNANSYYSKGDYRMAILTYKQLLTDENESATVYYNLANAYYKTDSIAQAVLYYEKAKKLNPGDENTLTNLSLANRKIQDRFDNVPSFSLIGFLSSFTSLFSVDFWAVSGLLIFLLASVAFILYFTSATVARKKTFFRAMLITAFISLVMFTSAQLQYYVQTGQQYAIIVSASVDAESSPDKQGKRLYVLHAGTKVQILTHLEDWTEVRLPDNNVAWIKAADIAGI